MVAGLSFHHHPQQRTAARGKTAERLRPYYDVRGETFLGKTNLIMYGFVLSTQLNRVLVQVS